MNIDNQLRQSERMMDLSRDAAPLWRATYCARLRRKSARIPRIYREIGENGGADLRRRHVTVLHMHDGAASLPSPAFPMLVGTIHHRAATQGGVLPIL